MTEITYIRNMDDFGVLSHRAQGTCIDFFTRLSQLCIDHKGLLNGCGCCSSPIVEIGSIEFGDVSVDETGRVLWGIGSKREKFTLEDMRKEYDNFEKRVKPL